MTTAAFLDTNVLFSTRLSSVLTWAATRKLYRPLWSEHVLDSVVYYTVERGHATREGAQARMDTYRRLFRDAMVTGFEDLEPLMRNDPGDRHVLAAAVRGHADVLVTENLDDFPDDEMDRHGIEAMHPDDFLLELLDEHGEDMVDVVKKVVSTRQNPYEPMHEFLTRLGNAKAPEFAAAVRELVEPPAAADYYLGLAAPVLHREHP